MPSAPTWRTCRPPRRRQGRGGAGIKYFDGEVTPEKLGYSFYADRNSLALSDTVILNDTYLCVVSEVAPFNITADRVMTAIVESLHAERMGMIPMFNLDTGELSTTPEFAYGELLQQGDWVISTETGMLGKVVEVTEQNTSNAMVTVRCLTELYAPPQMAPAIRTLAWDTGLKPRALLLSDGTLELNYREDVSTSLPRVEIVKHWEVDPAGYASAGARPWDDDKLSVRRTRFTTEFAQAGITSIAYYLAGCSELTDVMGFEALEGVTYMGYMFQTCSELRSIYAASEPTSVAKGSMMFYGCTMLVGSQGYVPKNTDGHSKLTYEGVLTDPNYDLREWCYGLVYADGELVISRRTTRRRGASC